MPPLIQSLPSITACPINTDDIQSHPTHLNPPKSQLELTRSDVLITPDSGSVIATSGREEVARRARCDRDNRVFVSLEHHLSMSRVGVPELHAPIFGAAHHPFSARCQAHAKYVVLAQG
jgi:hypothetical protein